MTPTPVTSASPVGNPHNTGKSIEFHTDRFDRVQVAMEEKQCDEKEACLIAGVSIGEYKLSKQRVEEHAAHEKHLAEERSNADPKALFHQRAVEKGFLNVLATLTQSGLGADPTAKEPTVEEDPNENPLDVKVPDTDMEGLDEPVAAAPIIDTSSISIGPDGKPVIPPDGPGGDNSRPKYGTPEFMIWLRHRKDVSRAIKKALGLPTYRKKKKPVVAEAETCAEAPRAAMARTLDYSDAELEQETEPVELDGAEPPSDPLVRVAIFTVPLSQAFALLERLL